ncbi:MAG: nucleotidyltransferase domain-containing protein [Firmicutes bacterium]|nr:nucleotidyltransferase domain-containing protein [Bacillota bacterium]
MMITFRSKITIKVLDYFFLNPETSHYVNELARLLDLDLKNLHRKLQELEKEGILKSEFRGKERYFFLNKSYPILDSYKDIFLKTVGVEGKIKEILHKVPGISKAFIFGSYAENTMDADSDIDLLMVGKHSVIDLQKKINKLQKEIGREINIINYDAEDFKKKQKTGDAFLKKIFSKKLIELK